MAKQTRKRLGAATWRGLLASQVQSGLSVAAFCAREGVSAASFYQWRSRLGGVDRVGSGRDDPMLAEQSGASPTFVDLGPLGGSTGRFELRLDLGGGLVLHLARG